jgi:hypothetical protein
MKRYLIRGLILGSATVIGTAAVTAQQAPPPPAKAAPAEEPSKRPPVVMRAYDVQDLLVIVKDYPISGPLIPPTKSNDPAPAAPPIQGGVPAPAPAPVTPPVAMDSLKALIVQTVDMGSWKDNGGDTGSISTYNSELFILQTEENHAAIQHLFDELRKVRTRMVRVRADWVLLSRGELDKLQKNGGDDTAALPEVSRKMLDALPQNTVHYTGQIVCFSGQTVHVAAGRARNVVTSVTPVVAPGSVAMQPSVQYTHYGVSLEINPTVSTDSATLDLSSVVSDAANPGPADTTQPGIPTVDRASAVVQNFHTTVQVPLNKPVLVGGSTSDPAADQASGKELYLIVEADTAK